MKKPMWNSEAVKAYETGQGVELVTTPHPHYRPLPKEWESQEPVALETVYETIIQWDEGGGKRSRRDLARRIIDLYTHPPQRTWVGLTDEERNAIEAATLDLHGVPKFFATAIEAKLKEKNG